MIVEALGGDDEIHGGDRDEDIRIQAGNSKIYGGLGWDTLEIDDKTSDYVTITYTDGEKNGIVQGYNSDGVELYISEFESINRIVQVSEIDFRFSGGENNDTVKLYELPLANPKMGILVLTEASVKTSYNFTISQCQLMVIIGQAQHLQNLMNTMRLSVISGSISAISNY